MNNNAYITTHNGTQWLINSQVYSHLNDVDRHIFHAFVYFMFVFFFVFHTYITQLHVALRVGCNTKALS